LLRSCSNLEQGKQIHARARRIDLEKTPLLASLLISMYTRCGDLDSARQLFQSTPQPDIHARNSLITAYARSREIDCAREVFDEMLERDLIAWNAMVSAYALAGQMDQARMVVFEAMPQRDAIAWGSMITALARAGDPDRAKTVFESMPERDLAAWTTMIKAFGDHADNGRRAEEIYQRMPSHDAVAAAAMITAFAQCGHLRESRALFASIPEWNLDRGSWNTMIAACARYERGREVVELLRSMHCEGEDPDEVSFVAALLAHSHTGMLEAAGALFRSMRSDHWLDPSQEHYWAMIDVLARVGRIADAEELVNTMPFLPDDVAWATL
ncbi:hypothetical protein SELMODRAFT_12041, partial [Selaginella moellendorffii]